MDLTGYLLIALAAVGAGAINAAAGGGTLITFPAMLAAGMSPLAANMTSSIGLLFGTLGGAWSYRDELRRQRRRFVVNAPFAAIGGVIGAVLLLVTPSAAFTEIVPWLVLLAAALFAIQPALTKRLNRSAADTAPPVEERAPEALAAPPVEERAPEALASRDHTGGWPAKAAFVLIGAYGCYFGAGIGIMMLALLGLVIHDTLQHHNALKNIMAAVINGTGAIILAFSPLIHWGVVAIMLGASLLGGLLGGWLSRRVPSWLLRIVVIGFALAVALAMLLT
ncbi:sulfite exporter TauE/SafE family protein [Agrococcus sp. Marseille-P2731]|uniref:sulfite exporter TauE/SafE family protein n=1 Tax=Agrococcus sp. Marseille-P2731 TaxID=1841862 RepID=UPI000931886D|nr:sulfite exporter TauE/SafE family protein [Agrococcus sp. Marseille-P2731]